MRGLIVAVAIVAILGLGAFLLVNNKNKENPAKNSQTTTSESISSDNNSQNTIPLEVSGTVTITYSDSGFSPASAAVKNGGKIVWVNNSRNQLQIGVDPHPSHTGNKAITNDQFTLDLAAGATSEVSVTQSGSFGYHNHLAPEHTGTVTVQ